MIQLDGWGWLGTDIADVEQDDCLRQRRSKMLPMRARAQVESPLALSERHDRTGRLPALSIGSR